MFNTLSTKIAAILLGLFCVIGVLFALVSRFFLNEYMLEVTQKLNRPMAEFVVSHVLPSKQGSIDNQTLRSMFDSLMLINPAVELYLLDGDGKILAYSAPPGKVVRKVVALEPLRRYLSDTPAYPIVGDDPRDTKRKKIFSVARLDEANPDAGYLYAVLGGEEFDELSRLHRGSYALKLSSWAIGLSLAFAFLTGLFVFYVLTRRIKRLAVAMETFRDGGFSQPTNLRLRSRTSGGDEIERLGAIFKQMEERIVAQIQTLTRTDAMRRRLVAHVSHDLRTAMVPMRGYLQTLHMKEGAMSAEEQRSYLESALRSSDRLSALAEELFELAKLEFQETDIPMESFSLAELVHDVVRELQLSANEKRITLSASLGENLLFACANIGLTERVFVNLIDNAIRHTPEGGEIEIALTPGREHITVEISDTGPGIADENLPLVFEPFYTASGNAGTPRAGTGLGLAIVKRILELHGCPITVQSGPRGGARFTFQIPISEE